MFTLFAVLLSLLITGGLLLFFIEQSVDKHVEMHLESVAVLKKEQLEHYFYHQYIEIQNIKDRPLVELLQNVTNENTNYLETQIRQSFLDTIKHTEFFEVFILDLDGKIILSTDVQNEKKIRKDREYFEQGKNKIFMQIFYYSLTLENPAITIARPVKDQHGNLYGVLAARVSLDVFDEVMTEDAGLGDTGETYLVNKYNYAVTELARNKEAALRTIVHTAAVSSCLEKKNQDIVFDFYKNYNEEYVFGSYVWLPEYNSCMLVEISELEAHEVLYKQMKTITFVLLLILFCTFFGVLYFSREIRKPLLELERGTKKIAQGDMEYKLKINTDDEIGDVAKSFNQMVNELKESNKEIENHERELAKKVNQRTKEVQKKLEELENTKLAVINILEDTDASNKELLELRDKLNQTIKELKAMDKRKDEFLSITAHELKTPLTSIRGFIELLKLDKVMQNKETRDKYFNIIIDDTHRLGQLITDILDLSRLDIGTMKFNMEHVSVSQLFEELKNLVDLAIKNKGVKSIYKYDKDIPDLYVDKSRLLQVISNLVNNSIKYTEKGHIKIIAEKKGDYVHFIVEDTGKGIPKKEHKKIFKRFYQVDSSYTRKVGGTGLGLAICQGIIEKLGGKIWVEKSEIDKGTVMKFKIPLKK